MNLTNDNYEEKLYLPPKYQYDRMIFKDLNEMNKKYGVFHNNYARYLKYCNNKLLSLRSKLKIKNIKSKSYFKKELDVQEIVRGITNFEGDRFDNHFKNESHRISQFLSLSLVEIERDLQKANWNVNKSTKNVEDKLVEGDEKEKEFDKYHTERKMHKCLKHFRKYLPQLQQLCSDRVVWDFVLYSVYIMLNLEYYRKKDVKAIKALGHVLQHFSTKGQDFYKEFADCKEYLQNMNKLANASIKYLEFIDSNESEGTLEENVSLVNSILKDKIGFEFDLLSMFDKSYVRNEAVINPKIVDPSRSFKFNGSILIISNERVLSALKKTMEYFTALKQSKDEEIKWTKQKEIIVQISQTLEEALKVQKKADFSNLLDFSNANKWDSETMQFLKYWKCRLQAVKTCLHAESIFTQNEIHQFILANFVYSFKRNNFKVNDPSFRAMKNLFRLLNSLKNIFQELSLYSQDSENDYHNSCFSGSESMLLVFKSLIESLSNKKYVEAMNYHLWNFKKQEATLQTLEFLHTTEFDQEFEVKGCRKLMSCFHNLLQDNLLDKLLVGTWLKHSIKASLIEEHLDDEYKNFPYVDPRFHIEKSLNKKHVDDFNLCNVYLNHIQDDYAIDEYMKENEIESKLKRLIGDNKVKDGLVKGILKRIPGWFGRK